MWDCKMKQGREQVSEDDVKCNSTRVYGYLDL